MLRFYIIGVSHTTTPLHIRENLSVQHHQIVPILHELVSNECAKEVLLLSTCNRLEIYFISDSTQHMITWLINRYPIISDDLMHHIYIKEEQEAFEHVARVSSGVDSMILGEAQILGQFKKAMQWAQEAQTLGSRLFRLCQQALTIAKEIRHHTSIGRHVVSVASLAMKLAKNIYSDLSEKKVLFIGTGKIGALCLKYLTTCSLEKISITNRTYAHANVFAQKYKIDIFPFEDLSHHLYKYDIILSCVSVTQPIITFEIAQKLLIARKRHPILMIDLAVPRSLSPNIKNLEDIFLYSIDDLSRLAQSGQKKRQEAVQEAEKIIKKNSQEFWLNSHKLKKIQTIKRLRHYVSRMADDEVRKIKNKIAPNEKIESLLDGLAHSIVNKILHAPVTELHHMSHDEEAEAAALINRLFRLNPSE